MNCRTVRRWFPELLTNDSSVDDQVFEHLQQCEACRRELDEAHSTLSSLRPLSKIQASQGLKENIMSRAAEQQASVVPVQRQERRARSSRFVAVAIAATFMIAVAATYNFYAGRTGKQRVDLFSTMAQAAEAMSQIRNIHIKAKMRGIPRDNFEYIVLDRELIPVDIWKSFEGKGPWRAEKEGRKVVYDGTSTFILIQGEGTPLGAKLENVNADGLLGSMHNLLDIPNLLNKEIVEAKREGSKYSVSSGTGPDGKQRTILKVEAKAFGDFSKSDHSRNTSIMESDNSRTYTFDAENHRLISIQVNVQTTTDSVVVFETTGVEYDQPEDKELYTLNAPANTVWEITPEKPAPLKAGDFDSSKMMPDEAARTFFEACSKKDWDKARALAGAMIDMPEVKEAFATLEIVSIGKPFQSGAYPGWFVPYEIRIMGHTKKHNLAMRNDNPNKQWMVDGGI